MTAGEFKGTLLGVEYTDRKAFEKAAKGLGYVQGKAASRRAIDWKVGTEVRVEVDGRKVCGQVWAKAAEGWVWLALESRRFVAVHTRTLEVSSNPGQGVIGRVA